MKDRLDIFNEIEATEDICEFFFRSCVWLDEDVVEACFTRMLRYNLKNIIADLMEEILSFKNKKTLIEIAKSNFLTGEITSKELDSVLKLIVVVQKLLKNPKLNEDYKKDLLKRYCIKSLNQIKFKIKA